MKDSTIFKLAAGAGILAFIARLIFVQPEELGVEGRRALSASGDPVGRLALAGDYKGALRVASTRQRERYLDQNGWSRIANLLHDFNTKGGEPFDAAEALESFADIAPRPWVRESGALGWAAYFLAFQTREDEAAQAEVAWRYGAEVFESLIRERPDEAVAWDWLYRARTYMRLEENLLAADALRDGATWVDAALLADEGAAVDDRFDFLRTYGRTWAAVGELREAESLWRRLNERLLETQPAVSVAEMWRGYATNMYRSDEWPAGDLALDICVGALQRAGDDPDEALRAAALWHDVARRYERRERSDLAEPAWEQALAYQRVGAEVAGGPNAWFDLARLLATRVSGEEALVALERAVDEGFINPDRLRGDDAFEAIRDDPRFLALADRIDRALDEMYGAEEVGATHGRFRRNGR